jgi:RecA-family ATPase
VIAQEHVFTLADSEEGSGLSKFDRDLKAVRPALVIIDPILAYLGGKVDMNKANEVRAFMKELAERAKRFGASILTVRHLRKSGGGGKAIYGV